MDLENDDIALLRDKAGVTPDMLTTLQTLGFTVTRTASLLSYMKDLADTSGENRTALRRES
ncbi:hypothetical protein [Acetobacter oeni]|uniref:Uncharacterized protein n=2 Tax=Acetobacter oeni TaxID=304077 RepID=A0A511XK75_9PROT|nr:hypothetical protein [Acetobacter oeni]MBB3883152.1 hypothetical protein [Acetobacter oeni]NHO19208.1 hypothetical protein [Acetobacter oeni]GBR05154.1 hypothetical protein AA21952_1640 [Acetobacter oeni LMG 21952]GEN63332.1 hypothetical protein AOE01nite_15560 [Acetobacter oeni]